jgi:hypothetical protein
MGQIQPHLKIAKMPRSVSSKLRCTRFTLLGPPFGSHLRLGLLARYSALRYLSNEKIPAGNTVSLQTRSRRPFIRLLCARKSRRSSAQRTSASAIRGNDNNIRETIENLRVATENLAQLSAAVRDRPFSLVRIR